MPLIPIPSWPEWDFWNWGMGGAPLDPNNYPTNFPGLGLLSEYLERDWLCMSQNATGGKGTAMALRLPHGLRHGRLQSVLWQIGMPADCGLLVLCDHPSMEPGSGGQGYAFCISTYYNQFRLLLVRFHDGIDVVPRTSIATSADLVAEAEHADIPGLGPFGELRVQWEIDPVELQALHLECWVGSGLGAPQQRVIDVTYYGPDAYLPAPETPLYEGLYFYGTTNATGCLFTSATLWTP